MFEAVDIMVSFKVENDICSVERAPLLSGAATMTSPEAGTIRGMSLLGLSLLVSVRGNTIEIGLPEQEEKVTQSDTCAPSCRDSNLLQAPRLPETIV